MKARKLIAAMATAMALFGFATMINPALARDYDSKHYRTSNYTNRSGHVNVRVPDNNRGRHNNNWTRGHYNNNRNWNNGRHNGWNNNRSQSRNWNNNHRNNNSWNRNRNRHSAVNNHRNGYRNNHNYNHH